MPRRVSKPAIFNFALHVVAASFLASITVVIFYQWWVFDLFSHFRIQYVLLGFLLLPALLWLKKYWVAAAVAVAVIFHSITLWPYLQGTRVMASIDEPEHLTIVFANIYYKSPDFEKMKRLMDTEKPDIIFFAELPQAQYQEFKELVAQEYPHTGFEEGRGAYDMSYFSKKDPAITEIHTFSEDNPSILVKYDVNGSIYNILSVHPQSPVAAKYTRARDQYLDAALSYATGLSKPTIVIGDFNISQFSPKFPKLIEKYGLIDTQLEFGIQPSWHADKPPILRIPIDQALVSEEVIVYDRYLGTETGSDHLPVVLKIAVQ